MLLKKVIGLLDKQLSYTTINQAFQRLNLLVVLSMDIPKSLFMERISLIWELEKCNAFSTEQFIWMVQWWKMILSNAILLLPINGSSLKISIHSLWLKSLLMEFYMEVLLRNSLTIKNHKWCQLLQIWDLKEEARR